MLVFISPPVYLGAFCTFSSMLSILSLGLKKGTEVKVSADGPQEEEAVKAIIESIRSVTE